MAYRDAGMKPASIKLPQVSMEHTRQDSIYPPKQKPSSQVSSEAFLERLKQSHEAPCEDLEAYPDLWAEAIQDKVGRDLQLALAPGGDCVLGDCGDHLTSKTTIPADRSCWPTLY